MWGVNCPNCGANLGFKSFDTKLVRAECTNCAHKFTALSKLETYDGWVKIGCWE